jgi:hypothetical protein
MDESFLVIIEFAIKVQLKGLTHMFCLLMSSYKVYKEDAFYLDFTFRIMYHLGRVKKNLTLKAKHKIK